MHILTKISADIKKARTNEKTKLKRNNKETSSQSLICFVYLTSAVLVLIK